MKKIIICISVFIVIFLSFFVVENSFSKDKIEFVDELKNVEYSFAQLPFYASADDAFDQAADLQDINFKAVAVDKDFEIQFKLEHKPLQVYELDANEPSGKLKTAYDKEIGLYSLSSLSDTEFYQYTVVADYGIKKNVYSFFVYNKTYIEANSDKLISETIAKSEHSFDNAPKNVSIKSELESYSQDYSKFSFKINNKTDAAVKCSEFQIEKRINGEWYCVERNDLSYNSDFENEINGLLTPTVKADGTSAVEIPAALGVMFDLSTGNGLLSGEYRIVQSYEFNGQTNFAVFEPFTIGYN